MGRGKDLQPRKQRILKAKICLKHGIEKVRRGPSKGRSRGDLRCYICAAEKARKYRKDDPNRYADNQRRSYLKDPRRYMLYRAKARAEERGVPFDVVKEDITIPEFCPVLGIPLIVGTGDKTDNSPSLDRIIPCLGYVQGNVQVISDKANRIKSNASIEDLRRIILYLQSEKD
jgi:hypothetical protein